MECLFEDYVESTLAVFAECPRVRRLQLLTVDVAGEFLIARFEGPRGDFRGPYGIIVRLPVIQEDGLWVRYTGGGEETVRDWVHTGVALRAVKAHAAAQDHARGYTCDNTWWLTSDRVDHACLSGQCLGHRQPVVVQQPVLERTGTQRDALTAS